MIPTRKSHRMPRRRVIHLWLRTVVALLAVLCLGGTAVAQQRVSSGWNVDLATEGLEPAESTLELSLEDAIAAALQRNLQLRIQRFARAQSLFGVQQATGIYDFNIGVNTSMDEETQASVSVLDGADVRESEGQSLGLRLDQLINTGGTVSLNWQNRRNENNSTFSQLNPSFNVGFDLLFSQPLLQNGGRLVTERGIRVAQLDTLSSLDDLELAIADTIQQVENAYWTLVEAREQLAVAEESLSLAENLHEMNKVQVEVGTKAPLELVTSEAGIATRQEEIIRAQAAVGDGEDVLRQLLNLEDTFWALQIVPQTDPEIARPTIDLNQALQTAIQKRPELRSEEVQLQRLELDSRFFRKQRQPRLDLDVRYGYNGVGGDFQQFLPGSGPFDPNPQFITVPGGLDDALQQIADGDFDGWQIGLNFGLPLQNRDAKARSTIADLALEQGRTRLDDLLLSIRTEVRRTARGVQSAAQQIDSARVSRQLSERNLEAEQKRYDNGLSTSFQVLEIQEDLSAARSREVSAITGYRRALAAFYRAIGSLLEENRVEIDDVTDLDSLKPPKQ